MNSKQDTTATANAGRVGSSDLVRHVDQSLETLPSEFEHAINEAWKWGFFVPFCAFGLGVVVGMLAMKLALMS